MARERALVDSSFLFALFDYSSRQNRLATQFAKSTLAEFVVPDVTLTETAYLFNRAGGTPAMTQFISALVSLHPRLEPITEDTLQLVIEILKNYSDAKFDFVDCCLMALAEKLNIVQV